MNTTSRTTTAAPADGEPASILALEFDLVHVRTVLLEMISGHYRVAGWLQTQRRSSVALDVQAGELLQQLGARLHRTLWNEAEAAPFTLSHDPAALPPLGQVVVTASVREAVRVWLVGLTATQSLAAAEEALTNCLAQVIGRTLYSADLQIGGLDDQLAKSGSDVIVLVGGYDSPDSEALQPLYDLARLLGTILARLAPAQRPHLIFAGNRWAAAGVAEIVRAAGAGQVEVVENVRPAPAVLRQAALAQAVSFAYWQLCRRSEGMRAISRWVTAPGHITSLESSFAQLVQVWMEVQELPELHGLYCGPAWWLHVRAQQAQQGLDLRYVQPNSRPAALDGWPALQLVSGEWPIHLWPRLGNSWWDRGALAPLVGAVGQVAPQAMLDALRADLLEVQP